VKRRRRISEAAPRQPLPTVTSIRPSRSWGSAPVLGTAAAALTPERGGTAAGAGGAGAGAGHAATQK
jgi:hypothetical protein